MTGHGLYHEQPVHATSKLLGFVDLEGCIPFDLAPCNFSAHCFDCSERNLMRTLVFDRKNERNCTTCHKAMSVVIDKIEFFNKKKKAAENGGEGGGGEKKVKNLKIPGINLGDQLPQKGACKHYAHSYRWLRFPCCGRGATPTPFPFPFSFSRFFLVPLFVLPPPPNPKKSNIINYSISL